MIIDKLENSELYCSNESLRKSFEFLKTLNSDSEEKRYELDDNIFAVIESYPTKPLSEGRLEAHRKYIDIQMVLSGEETICWHNINGLSIETPYDVDKDILFFKLPEKIDSLTTLYKGTFMLLYPEDGHMPQIQAQERSEIIKKVVVKIPI